MLGDRSAARGAGTRPGSAGHQTPTREFSVGTIRENSSGTDTAILVTLHDLSLAARFCDRLVVLDHGRIAADGAPDAVLTPSVLAAVFAVSAACGRRDGQPFVVPWKVVPRLRDVGPEQDSSEGGD